MQRSPRRAQASTCVVLPLDRKVIAWGARRQEPAHPEGPAHPGRRTNPRRPAGNRRPVRRDDRRQDVQDQVRAEFPELAFTIRRATSAGALCKEHGKLRATATWRKLQPKPLERWLRAADALPSLGPLTAFHAHNPYRGPSEILDNLLEDLLHHLEPEPTPFETALDDLLDLADTMYEWRSPYLQDPDHRRSSFRYDLDLLTRILSWAGILGRSGATVQPDRWGHRDRLADGTLHLTTLGRWWLATR